MPEFHPPQDVSGFTTLVEATTGSRFFGSRRSQVVRLADLRATHVRKHIERLSHTLHMLGIEFLKCPVVVFRGELFPPDPDPNQMPFAAFEHREKVLLIGTNLFPKEAADARVLHDLIHEIGHHYWALMPAESQTAFAVAVTTPENATHVARSPTEYGTRSVEEAFAEWFTFLAAQALTSSGVDVVAGPTPMPHGRPMDCEEFCRLGGPTFDVGGAIA